MTDRVVPFLWFDGRAKEAAEFYVSLFPNSRITDTRLLRDSPAGPCFSAHFELDGRPFVAFDGGPAMTFSPAISLFVNCTTQEEIDRLWSALAEGGQPMQCGWVTDRFGVTWQVVPTVLLEMLYDDDEERADRVMQAMLPMVKLDIATLERAHGGR